MPTESAQQALAVLRNPETFQWYVIPLFALVVYVYAVEVERRNWSLVSFWVHDMECVKKKAAVVGTILGVDAVALLVFGGVLGWI